MNLFAYYSQEHFQKKYGIQEKKKKKQVVWKDF